MNNQKPSNPISQPFPNRQPWSYSGQNLERCIHKEDTKFNGCHGCNGYYVQCLNYTTQEVKNGNKD